ncbi:hypothetical protein E2C01_000437 [Portunus trituberculatus]|uniref:Uncharacterized protein n=1 Tax=Portunus trituberculatus TaxID=210409 RepID=A0A5B7CEB7_PORTR|nr:hypothetical protein [Portunus trituberculatus]
MSAVTITIMSGVLDDMFVCHPHPSSESVTRTPNCRHCSASFVYMAAKRWGTRVTRRGDSGASENSLLPQTR